VGWRGYALPRLQARYGRLPGALMVGALHGAWHLPLFLVPVWSHSSTPLSAAGFVLAMIAYGVVIARIMESARGSLLLAILAHAGINAAALWRGRSRSATDEHPGRAI
jgi:membrane protease YdiL (CAAX protease family)